MEKVRLSVVSYSNTLPFKYGIENSEYLKLNAEIFFDNPVECSKKLSENLADIGLIPVTAFIRNSKYKIVSDYCLAAKQNVESVLLLSDVPIYDLKSVFLDYQSLTSINMFKILSKFYWKTDINFIESSPGYEKKINNNVGGIVIGDRALMIQHSYKYKYDLASEWFKFTGYPAVFAVWVANKKIETIFLRNFNKSLGYGVKNIDLIIKLYKSQYRFFDLQNYLTNCIDYDLDEMKMKSIDIYREFLFNL